MKLQDILESSDERPFMHILVLKGDHLTLDHPGAEELLKRGTKIQSTSGEYHLSDGTIAFGIDALNAGKKLSSIIQNILDDMTDDVMYGDEDERYVRISDVIDDVIFELKQGKVVDLQAAIEPIIHGGIDLDPINPDDDR